MYDLTYLCKKTVVLTFSSHNFLYIHHFTQISVPIQGTVLPVHRAPVIRTLPVLRLHLTCAPRHEPGVTGVNVIKDTMEMASIAQVCSFFLIFTVESYTNMCHITEGSKLMTMKCVKTSGDRVPFKV